MTNKALKKFSTIFISFEWEYKERLGEELMFEKHSVTFNLIQRSNIDNELLSITSKLIVKYITAHLK